MHLRRAAAPLILAALVAACSGSAATSAPSAGAVAQATGTPAASTDSTGYDAGGYKTGGASPAAASGGLALATTGLGTVLVGAGGKTLYIFTPDTSTTSACTDKCASTWPPLTGALPALGQSLAAADFATLTRADGTAQLTFHGQPLYYFSGDQAAGDTNGQGLGGKWYVVGGDGKPIK